MLVFEYQCKLKFLKSINHKTIAEKINYFLDSVLAKDQEFLQYHENKGYKYYVTDAPWPIEKDGIYKEGKVYTLRIRTVKQELAEFFSEKLYAHTSKELLGIGGKLRIIPKKHIEELYSITPIVVKTDEGYWRGNMTVPEFEKIIKINLIKKYKQFTGQNISEDILLYDVMKFNNRVPIKVSYKNINLLGDKLSFRISNEQLSQELAYFALGVGLGCNNARGTRICELQIFIGKEGRFFMLQEAMEVFQIMLQEKGERIITDAYIPKDGTYRLIVMKDDGWVIKDPVDIIFNKKTNTVDISNDMDYLLIQELDYKSKLLEMNKPIDPKKVIHSNNYLSLAVKKESVTSGKLSEEIIQQYYEILRNPNKKYEKKPQARALYHVAEERLGQPDIKVIDKIEKFILANKEDIWKGINLEKKNYVKLFFVYQEEEKTKEIYKIESERYLIPNIYNNNNFNMEFEKGIVGLPNDNMGMNSKKPYLENKTRKVKVPYLLDQESALLQSKFFDYLFGQVSKKRFHIYVDNIDKKICSYTNKDKPEDIVSGYYLRCRMGKAGAEICEADVIIHYKTKLEPGLVLKNYIEIPEERIEKSKIHYDEAIEDQWVIMDLINGIFFEGKLKNNFFTDAKDMNIYDDCLKQSILKSRNILANWFWRGEQNQLVKILDNVSLALIKNSILNDETFDAQRKFNLRWSLLEYLDDQEVGVHMSEIRNQLREHINVAKDVEWDFISDEEYSYAVGQAVSYLLHLSKANNKTESYVNPFFNAKNSKVIKQRLLRMYKKYNYQIIHINGGRNAQLLSHVMEYEPKEIKHELIMAGFTAPSLMYEKKTDDEDNE